MASGWRATDGSSCFRRDGPIKPKAIAFEEHAHYHARRPPTVSYTSIRAMNQTPVTDGSDRWCDSTSSWSAGSTPAERPDATPALSEVARRRESVRATSFCHRRPNRLAKSSKRGPWGPSRDFDRGTSGQNPSDRWVGRIGKGYDQILRGMSGLLLLVPSDATSCGRGKCRGRLGPR